VFSRGIRTKPLAMVLPPKSQLAHNQWHAPVPTSTSRPATKSSHHYGTRVSK
jgi:hypothetical protein